MKKLKLKVCGMRDPDNIHGLVKLSPDFIGFIFYPQSGRYAANLDESIVNKIPTEIKKVGVFVNDTLESVVDKVEKYQLDYVQLHGGEDLAYLHGLKKRSIGIIKVFRVSKSIVPKLTDYAQMADYFLFDTASVTYGGTGKKFDWNVLNELELKTPFFLSGGIGLQDVDKILSLPMPNLIGIDVNSQFEIMPGLKDLDLVGKLIDKL